MPEFNLIERYFKPLVKLDGALKLEDDGALVSASAEHSLVLSKDMMVAGVHFDAALDPKLIAQKLLRVNLSDLAAMGAKPISYLLGLSLPKSMSKVDAEKWLTRFVVGLAEDQKLYDISLLGGDTVSVDGDMVLSLTIIGEVPLGQAIKRSGAKNGDAIFVTGTLGDAALGLQCMKGELELSENTKPALIERLHLPQPRLDIAISLRKLVHAAIDVSDGLLADVGHVLKASKKGATIYLDKLPLSKAVEGCFATEANPLENLWPYIYAGGDDYELLFTAPTALKGDVIELGKIFGVNLTEIGVINEASGINIIDANGIAVEPKSYGYDHFSEK